MITPEELREIPLFSNLPEAELKRLARSVADIRVRAGEYVAHEGEERSLSIAIAFVHQFLQNAQM